MGRIGGTLVPQCSVSDRKPASQPVGNHPAGFLLTGECRSEAQWTLLENESCPGTDIGGGLPDCAEDCAVNLRLPVHHHCPPVGPVTSASVPESTACTTGTT